jgi:hypothetical protein
LWRFGDAGPGQKRETARPYLVPTS